jgi:hypothetical protein
MKNVNTLYNLYKNGMGTKIQKLRPKILINSIYKNNELGKKMTYDTYGTYVPCYPERASDNVIIEYYGNDGWKYHFWKALSNKIMSRQIANIKNSYLEIYQILPYTMKLLRFNNEVYFDTHRNTKIDGSKGMCHYFILDIELDFTENIFKPKPEPVKRIKTGWFSSKPKELEHPNFGYTKVATDDDIYIEMKKLL